MTPEEVLSYPARVLTQAQREHYFDHGYIGVVMILVAHRGWVHYQRNLECRHVPETGRRDLPVRANDGDRLQLRIEGDEVRERPGLIDPLARVDRLLGRVADGARLNEAEAEAAFDTIMSGDATPAQIGAFLIALRLKGETVDEVVGAATAMRARMVRVPLDTPEDAIDCFSTTKIDALALEDFLIKR